MGVFPNDSSWKMQKKLPQGFLGKISCFNNSETSFEHNTVQIDHLSSHITGSSILLYPTLYCVHHYIVSSTLLC